MDTENEDIDKIMLKFMRENSKLAGKHDRIAVWSQATNYPGALGIHSENGRVAAARNCTEDKQLKSTVSVMESIHKKEIKSWNFTKKNVEDSMIAYSQKMQRISSDKYFDRIKIQNDLENSRKWASMSKLYDEAIKKATPEVKYSTELGRNVPEVKYPAHTDRGRSVSFSQPKHIPQKHRKSSTHERPKPDLGVGLLSASKLDSPKMRSRKFGAINPPKIFLPEIEKLPPPDGKLSPLSKNDTESIGGAEDELESVLEKDYKDGSVQVTSPDKEVSPREESGHVLKTKSPSTRKKKGTKRTKKKKTVSLSKNSNLADLSKEESPRPHHNNPGPIILSKNSTSEKVSSDNEEVCRPIGFNPHRRRSLSMPTSIRPSKHSQKSSIDCNGNDVALKSVLRHRKTSDITYLTRKSVQFQLPELDKSHFEVYRELKCEQSPNTICIVSND